MCRQNVKTSLMNWNMNLSMNPVTLQFDLTQTRTTLDMIQVARREHDHRPMQRQLPAFLIEVFGHVTGIHKKAQHEA